MKKRNICVCVCTHTLFVSFLAFFNSQVSKYDSYVMALDIVYINSFSAEVVMEVVNVYTPKLRRT